MTAVRILTVRQPWAWAIIHGGKNVENRVRNIAGDYRGPVLIHAARAVFEEEGGAWFEVQRAIHSQMIGYYATDDEVWEVADDVDPHDPRFVYGAIIGVVDLSSVHDMSEEAHGADNESPPQNCSPWAQWGDTRYHLMLRNPRALDEPIPYRGALGLRRTNFEIAGDWLYENTHRCTCGVGTTIGALYGHEPGCGLEPAARLAATT